jgi:hypothetical protein
VAEASKGVKGQNKVGNVKNGFPAGFILVQNRDTGSGGMGYDYLA